MDYLWMFNLRTQRDKYRDLQRWKVGFEEKGGPLENLEKGHLKKRKCTLVGYMGHRVIVGDIS